MFAIPINAELYDVDGTPVLDIGKKKLVFAAKQDKEFPLDPFIRKAYKADAECFKYWAKKKISQQVKNINRYGEDLELATIDEIKYLLRKTLVAYQVIYSEKNKPTVEFIDGEFNRFRAYIKPSLGGLFCTCPDSKKTVVDKECVEHTKYLKCIHLKAFKKITSKFGDSNL
jgi:hypothetical protein